MRHFAHDGLDVFYSTMYHNGWTTGELRSMYGRLLVQCKAVRVIAKRNGRRDRAHVPTYLPTKRLAGAREQKKSVEANKKSL